VGATLTRRRPRAWRDVLVFWVLVLAGTAAVALTFPLARRFLDDAEAALAALIAIFCRIHVPTIMLSLAAVNPLTMVPIYLLAYKVGVWVTGSPERHFAFSMSWDWVQHGLGPMW
jgi:uncharacterized protein (DUF2062 family)